MVSQQKNLCKFRKGSGRLRAAEAELDHSRRGMDSLPSNVAFSGSRNTWGQGGWDCEGNEGDK